jgi:threonyl-tRNA synthetase
MISIQKSLNQELEKVPFKLIEKVIAKKLSAAGVSASDELASKLLEHTLSGSKEKFIWDDGNALSQEVNISITDDDFAEIESRLKKFIEDDLPKIVEMLQNNQPPTFFDS